MSLRVLQALLRLERRQLLRERSKLLIMALLIALPVASLAFVGSVVTIIEPTADELVRSEMGIASFSVRGIEKPAQYEEATNVVGPSQRIYRGIDEVSSQGRIISAEALGIYPASANDLGLASEMIKLRVGRFPLNCGEVALSNALAAHLSLRIGDVVYLSYGAAREVVGLIENPEAVSSFQILRVPSLVERGGEHILLCRPTAGQSTEYVSALQDKGFRVTTEDEIRTQADGLTIGFVFVGSWIGFFEAALIIGAAQAISIKRRQREFGLLASIGGSSFQIFVSLLLATSAMAMVASSMGVSLGVLLAWLVHPFLDRWNNRLNGPFEVSVLFLSSTLILGIVASLFAVVYPAWRASRRSVREALLSSRPDPSRSSRWWLAGVALMGSSLLLLLFTSVGEKNLGATRLLFVPASFILGSILITPILLRASQFLCGLKLFSITLAIRDTARYRGRSSIATVAVFAAMSISIATAMVTASLQRTMDSFPPKLRNDQLLLIGPGAQELSQQVRRLPDCIAASPLLAAYSNGQPLRVRLDRLESISGRQDWIAIGDTELLRTIGIGENLGAFSTGAILSLNPDLLTTNPLVTTWLDTKPITLDRFVPTLIDKPIAGPTYIVNMDTVVGQRLQTGPPPNRGSVPWLVRFSRPIDDSTLQQVGDMVLNFSGTNIESGVNQSNSFRYATWLTVALSTMSAMVVVLSILALNFTESREEFRILLSIGAATGQMRWVVGLRAWYLTIMGCLLAIPSGIILACNLMQATNFPVRLTVPWSELTLVVFLVPLVIGLVSAACLHPWTKSTASNVGVQT